MKAMSLRNITSQALRQQARDARKGSRHTENGAEMDGAEQFEEDLRRSVAVPAVAWKPLCSGREEQPSSWSCGVRCRVVNTLKLGILPGVMSGANLNTKLQLAGNKMPLS